jgi:hypothetical protein
MSEPYNLDPLEGERSLPEERIFTGIIARLPFGEEYRLAPGRTELQPGHALTAGGCYDFAWTYFPETVALEPGAVVAFSIPRSWTQPRKEDPGPGSVRAETSDGSRVRITLTQNENVSWWIRAEVADEPVPKDGWVRVHCERVVIQRFPQDWWGNWRSAMRTGVDLGGDDAFAFVPADRTEKPVIRTAPPAKFYVVTPAVARPGEEIEIRVSALDMFGNRAEPAPAGGIFAAFPDDPFTPVAGTVLKPEDRGHTRLRVKATEAGDSFRVIVSDRRDRLRGSGPGTVLHSDANNLNVYFGDIHAKTMLSDGLKSPMEYFEHARDVALTDFGAIADHNCTEASRVEGPFRTEMTDEAFSEIQEACEAFNEAGRFVTLQGFEQNELQEYPGHRNVYFRGVAPGLFRGRTLEDLYEYLEGHDALVIPHHPIIWRTKVHLGNPRYERVVEMYSMHCSSEVKGSPVNNWRTTPGKAETGISAREILESGYRVGFIASSDNHNGAPGLSARPSRFTNLTYSGGLAAVFARELTREAVFDAMYARRCYATTGARIYLDSRLDGRMMGSETRVEGGRPVAYEITVSGTEPISRIEIVHNNRQEALWTHTGDGYVRLEGEWTFEEEKNWLYVRVTQEDRHMAWSSPFWVDAV